MTNAKPTEEKVVTKATSKRRWLVMPAVVIGLLGGHMVFIVTAITLGTGDPSFAVVPDYYQKAVDYDEHKALLAKSAELGWLVELMPSAQADTLGQRELLVRLRDTSGQPITGMAVKVNGYHQARAGEPLAFDCVEGQPGHYVGQATMSREGFWRFTVDASSGDQRFVAEVKQFVPVAEVVR